MVLRFATAPAHFFFPHFNLRTVLAVTSQTFAFLWMYRHCQALTYVMIIGLWLERLPGNIFLQYRLSSNYLLFQCGQALLGCLAGNDTPFLQHDVCQPKYRRRVQRNMKCVNRSIRYQRKSYKTKTKNVSTPTPPPTPTPLKNSTMQKNAKMLGRFSGRRQIQVWSPRDWLIERMTPWLPDDFVGHARIEWFFWIHWLVDGYDGSRNWGLLYWADLLLDSSFMVFMDYGGSTFCLAHWVVLAHQPVQLFDTMVQRATAGVVMHCSGRDIHNSEVSLETLCDNCAVSVLLVIWMINPRDLRFSGDRLT